MKKQSITVIFLVLITTLITAQIPQGNNEKASINSRFSPPPGFKKIPISEKSFGSYLRNLPLKPKNTIVKYFDGSEKRKRDVYIAVVNMDIGKKDLQQCADAVMRLRGEYLFINRMFDQIHFNFLVDGKPRYFKNYANGDYSYLKFRKYMDYVFASANTASLRNELQSVKMVEMKIGDVFIQKGNPYGHAVIVVDMAENPDGKKLYMLAQSYMPAQEIQILVNRNDDAISPWYELNDKTIYTPEWTFELIDLKRFKSE